MADLAPPPLDFGEVSVRNQNWRQFFLDLQGLLNNVANDGPIVVYTDDPHLPVSFNLGGLASGYLKLATALGIAVPSTVTFIPQSDLRWAPVVKAFVDTGYVSTAGQVVLTNAIAGATTIKLPAAPSDGQSVIVKKTDASGNAVTIDGNGHNVDGAGTHNLAAQWNSAICVYSSTSTAWFIAGQV